MHEYRLNFLIREFHNLPSENGGIVSHTADGGWKLRGDVD
jgi:hypothetical protein